MTDLLADLIVAAAIVCSVGLWLGGSFGLHLFGRHDH